MTRLRNSKYRILFWWIPLFLITGLAVLYSYSITIFSISYFDTFVVLNLKNEPVKVGESELLLFDSMIFEGQTKQSILIQDKTYTVENSAEASIIDFKVVSEDKYCFFTARVTDYYLINSDPELLQILTPEDNFLTLDVNWNTNDYLIPGLYGYNPLGKVFDKKEIIGIYPVKCEETTQQEKMLNLIKLYRYMVPEDQREVLKRIS